MPANIFLSLRPSGLSTGASDEANLGAISPDMSKISKEPSAGFTAAERDYIRRELDQFFSTLPSVADGFSLRTWRGGPDAGKPKLPPPAKALLERGLVRLSTRQTPPRL